MSVHAKRSLLPVRYGLLIASLLLPHLARAQSLATHGCTAEEIEQWRRGDAKDYHIVYLNGYDDGGTTRFAALAVKDSLAPLSRCDYNLSLERMQALVNEYRVQGYHPTCVSGYRKGKAPAFALLGFRDKRRAVERIGLHLTEREYAERLVVEAKQGYLPSMVCGYPDETNAVHFTALFIPSGGVVCKPQHDLTAQEYDQAMKSADAQGLRPISISVYPTAKGLRYAAIFLKRNGPKWSARSELSPEKYQATFDEMAKENLFPISIVGYRTPTTVDAKAYHAAVAKFMADRHIPIGTFAVSRGGKLLCQGGVSFPDVPDKRPDPGMPMRLASLSKPITAAAIYTLVRAGKLSLDTPAFPLLGLKPPPGQKRDPRLNRITVRHLLEHKGGWDRDKTFDPMFRSVEIAEALKAPCPPGPTDIIRYMMGQPLQFDPGSRSCYSNFGFCVLGRVIEKVTGQPYVGYVQKSILAPLGIKSIALGRTLPGHRNPQEPAYVDPGKGRNVVDPQSKDDVPSPDGTFYLEAMDAHGGLIGSSPDLVRFLEAYWISGERRKDNGAQFTFFGSLPGTFTMMMQRPNGVNIAVLFNQETDASGLAYNKIENVMRELADRPSGDETRYAAVWVKVP